MITILKAIGILIAWFTFGTVINIFSGWLSRKLLLKYYLKKGQDKYTGYANMDRDLLIRNMQEGYNEPTLFEIALDALFWPRTQWFAWIGQKRILKSLKEAQKNQNGSKNGENGGDVTAADE